MRMVIDDIMDFEAFHTTSDVTSCAQQIVTYITDHDNWKKPILPQQPGCDEMVFEPERFDWVFNKWSCSENFDGNSIFFMKGKQALNLSIVRYAQNELLIKSVIRAKLWTTYLDFVYMFVIHRFLLLSSDDTHLISNLLQMD